ncbi:MAPEG family protein [Asticcacaulis machinosus]|uniref:MAPEG family protein n=1 Tax=Asticcacaulis machinosus TaxID=2984211 RepID=A0ABT5HKK1_9CAUL|nr:MAPEG family protein [Asticcacaulis machinosus]MDC7676774.1 MAPEG family protein [Asticcacaulis machinosus]
MLHPVLALIAWTMLMLVWLYAARITALFALKVDPQRLSDKRLLGQLPPYARDPADNYANLLEQPVLFYALSSVIHLSGWGDRLFITLAWIYVGLRIVHSLIQALHNIVILRFCVFLCATGILSYMLIRTVRVTLNF